MILVEILVALLGKKYLNLILLKSWIFKNGEIRKKKKRLLRLDKYDFEDFSEDDFSKKIESGIISKTFGEPHFIIPFTDKYLNVFNEHIIGLAKSNLSLF